MFACLFTLHACAGITHRHISCACLLVCMCCERWLCSSLQTTRESCGLQLEKKRNRGKVSDPDTEGELWDREADSVQVPQGAMSTEWQPLTIWPHISTQLWAHTALVLWDGVYNLVLWSHVSTNESCLQLQLPVLKSAYSFISVKAKKQRWKIAFPWNLFFFSQNYTINSALVLMKDAQPQRELDISRGH